MSEWAIAKGFEYPITAFEFREAYLIDGIIYDDFKCPECSAKLGPVLIYSDDKELSKTPHFRAPKKHAIKDCRFGKPVRLQNAKISNRHFKKVNLRLPEELLIYRRSANHLKGILKTRGKETNSGRPLGPAKFRTSFIRVIAEAWIAVLSESYKVQRKNNWSDRERNQLFSDVLKESPINLLGFHTNYKTAIQDTYFPPTKYPRIYNGFASVTANQGIYYLNIDKQTKESTGKLRSCIVSIPTVKFEDQNFKHEQAYINALEKSIQYNQKIRWFAYGTFILDADAYQLEVTDLTHLHCYIPKSISLTK